MFSISFDLCENHIFRDAWHSTGSRSSTIDAKCVQTTKSALHEYGTYLTPSTFHDRILQDPVYNFGFSSPASSESHLLRTTQGLWLRRLVARELVCYQVLTFPRPGDIGEHVDEEEAR